MSDDTIDQGASQEGPLDLGPMEAPAVAEAPAPAPANTSPARGPARRVASGVWRWTKRIALAAAVVLLVGRATIGLWLPMVANRAVAPYDLHVSWDDFDLSLLGLSLDLVGVRVVPLPESDGTEGSSPTEEELAQIQPLARLDDLGFDADVSALLTGDLRVHRVEVSGLEAWVSRDADGLWNYERHLPAPAAEGAAEGAAEVAAKETVEPVVEERAPDAEEPSAENPEPLDFSSPIEISTIDIAGVRLHLHDALAVPTLDTALDLDVSVRDVGHPNRPIQARVVARAEEILDTLVLTAEADLGVAKLLVDLKLQVDGVGVHRLSPYLAPLGIVPSANKLNALIAAQVDLAPVDAGAAEADAQEVLDLAGNITLSTVRIDADGVVAAELLETNVKVTRARSALFELESAICSGLNAQATRLPSGAFRVAGLDFVGAPPTPEEPEEEGEEEEETEPSGPAPSFRLQRLALENVNVTLTDETFAEPSLLEAALTAEVTSIVFDPAEPGVPLGISIGATLKDAGALSLTGSAVPTGDTISADLALGGQGLTLAALRPHLEAAGLSSTLQNGALTAGLSFQMIPGDESQGESTRIQAALNGLALSDGDVQHLQLGDIALESFEQLPDGSSTIERVGLAGASLPVDVFPGGAFRGFGLETLGLDPDAVGRRLGLDGAEIGISNLAFGGDSSTATIAGSFELLGLVDEVQIDGSVVTKEGPLDMEATVSLTGNGVTLEGLSDVLLAQGIEPDFVDGQLRVSAEVSLKAGATEDSTLMDGRVFDFALMNRGAEAVAIAEVRIAGLASGPDGTRIGEIEVSGPQVAVARDDAGVLALAGLRIGVAASGASAVDPNATASVAPAPSTDAAPDEPSEPGAPGASLVIDRIALTDLTATWSDAFVSPSVQTEFSARAEVLDIDLGPETPTKPTRLTLEAGLAGALDSLTLEASAERGATTQSLEGSLALAGLKAGPLASYLPPGTIVTLEDGRLVAQFEASVEPAAEGGDAIQASITGLDYRDGADAESLLAFESLLFSAPRLDSDAAVFAIETVALEDLVFDAERTASDTIEVLGLALVSVPAEEAAAPGSEIEVPAEESAEESAGEPAEEVLADAKQPTPAASAPTAGPAGGARELPPTITLGRLDLGIERLRYLDRTRADAIPLDLSLALVTPGPQTLCLPDPLDLPPLEFSAVGKVSPIIDRLAITAGLEPFAADPGATLSMLIEGITGAELARVAPEVTESMDPSAFVDGSFEATADLRLALARRGPLDFNLNRGFGATFSIDKFALKENPEAVPTGFERLDVEVKRVDPKTGDVKIASVDLTGIYARVHQAENGMTVAGLLFPAAPEDPTAEDTESNEEDPSEEEAVAAAEPEDESPAVEAAPSPETSIERLTVSGLDFEFLDTTVEPPLRLPIEDLQLEVKRFTTRTFEEPRPFSFQAVIDAGEIELEERTGIDNLLFGVLNSAANAVTLEGNEFNQESRRVWDLLEATGRLSLGPETRGRIKLTLLGLELPAFRGPARASGMEIGDGLLDNRTSLRFREDGALSVDTKSTTSYLSLSEPADGPITKYLSLPAPLDTVLFLLRNSSGEQKLPVRLDVPPDGVSATQIAGLAANTLGVLITEAVSSAPLRVLGPLSSIAGALGLTNVPLTADTVTLEFTEGAATMVTATVVPPAEVEATPETEPDTDAQADPELTATVSAPANEDPLGRIALAMKSNPDMRLVVQAELGTGDLEVAEHLANPTRESIESLIQRNRYRKATLERERSRLSARAKAQIFAGSSSGPASEDPLSGEPVAGPEELVAQLQALDAERAAVEHALDDLFTYIRPGAERRAGMRTRNAALALADRRLDRVRLELIKRVGAAVAQRIDVRRARYRKSTEEKPLPRLGRVTVTPK